MSQDLDYHDSDLLETVDDVILFAFKFVKYFNPLSEPAPNVPETLLQPAGPVESAGAALPVVPTGGVASAVAVGPAVPEGGVAPVAAVGSAVPEGPAGGVASAAAVMPAGPEGVVAPVAAVGPAGQFGYPDALAELFEYMRRPMDVAEALTLGGIGNLSQVKEIETLFRVLLFCEIPPKLALERICANPYGYLTALKAVFEELRTDRPLTIEEDIIIAFKKHGVSRDAAHQVLNLRNVTVRKLWDNAVKVKMKKALEEVRKEREESLAPGARYRHLTQGERTFIAYARILGMSQKLIAEYLGRSPSTISREVRRLEPGVRGPKADYTPSRAWDDYVKKRRNCGRKDKLGLKDGAGNLLTALIRDFILHKKLSPEQIVFGKFKKMENLDCYPSKSTIYNWINSGKIYDLSRKNLRRKGKKRKKYYDSCKKYEKGTSILERPENINDRSEFGHFEADSVVSSHKGKGRVFTLVERKTRFFMGKVVLEGTADNFVDFIRKTINKYGNVIKSITVDNGSEFAGWEKLESMGIKVYFARPYCSNDKGCIEHHNGLLREFFPKKTDFSRVHQKTLDMKCLRLINIRPRKVLGWQSPQELFEHELKLARQATAA